MSIPLHVPAQAKTALSHPGKLSHTTKPDQNSAEQVPGSVHDTVRSEGQPLDTGTRTTMQARFGHDFSQVRVHTDEQAASSARSMRANAYTMGEHLAFDSGKYAPHTVRGQELLAHELTHVVQAARHPPVAQIIAPAHHPSEQEAAYAIQHPSHVPSSAPGGIVQRDINDLLNAGKEVVTKLFEIEQAKTLGEAAFLINFLLSAKATIPPDAFERLDRELRQPANAAAFAAGELSGIVVGAIKDLVGSIGGLLEMAVKVSPAYQIVSELNSVYKQGGWGYQGHPQVEQQKSEETLALMAALKDFVMSVAHDPNILVQIGGDLGAEAGKQSAKWFNEKFMTKTPFEKGETIGEVMGYILIEIALLFVGPEELAIRGGAFAAKAAEGTRLGRAILAALEKIPALKKILEARKLTGVGREVANIVEKSATAAEKGIAGAEKAVTAGEEASHLVAEASKGTTKAEEAAHVASSAEQKAAGGTKAASKVEETTHAASSVEQKTAEAAKPSSSQRPPGIDEATHEDVEKSFVESEQADTSGPYQTTNRLARGNFGERAATEALARDGHHILSYKPEITGTNQGGIDMVTMRNGIVYLIDNKALSRSGNISSVSALTTNLTKNIATVERDLTTMAADVSRPAGERALLQQALNSLKAGKFQLAVTNANITRDTQIITGVTDKLRKAGIQFINVFP